jgi:hypothetical protein
MRAHLRPYHYREFPQYSVLCTVLQRTLSQPPRTLAYYVLRTTYYVLRTTYYVLMNPAWDEPPLTHLLTQPASSMGHPSSSSCMGHSCLLHLFVQKGVIYLPKSDHKLWFVAVLFVLRRTVATIVASGAMKSPDACLLLLLMHGSCCSPILKTWLLCSTLALPTRP